MRARRGRGSRRGVPQGSLEGDVVEIARGGDAVVETEQGRVYVGLATVGDRVRVEDFTRQGKTLRARVSEVLRPGPDRRVSPCPIADECGGCAWIVMEDEAQRQSKRSRLRAALPNAPDDVALIHGASLAYRHRARLAWRNGRIGFRVRRSHDLCDIATCAVLAPPLNAALVAMRALPLRGKGEVSLALRDDRPVAVISTGTNQTSDVYQACERAVAEASFAGIALRVDGADATWGTPIERTLGADGEPVEGTLGGFSQAHGALNPQLVAHAAEQADAEGRQVLELYCGHGNLSVLLARGAASFVGVEQNAAAVDACRANLARRGLEGRIRVGDASSPPEGPFEVVVLDPPRIGAEAAVRALAGRRSLRRVVYVSCHLATLARDLRVLAEAGWQVTAACGFDMFPQTPHLESVVSLRRG